MTAPEKAIHATQNLLYKKDALAGELLQRILQNQLLLLQATKVQLTWPQE